MLNGRLRRRSLAGAALLWALLALAVLSARSPRETVLGTDKPGGSVIMPATGVLTEATLGASETAFDAPVPIKSGLAPAVPFKDTAPPVPAAVPPEVLPSTGTSGTGSVADGTGDTEPSVSRIQTPADDGASFFAEPPVSAATVAASGGELVRPLRFSATVTASLPDAAARLVYTLSVGERGAIQVFLTYDRLSLFSTAGWQASLYEEYSVDGRNGATALRLLTTMTTNSAAEESVCTPIGVLPGNYRLVITAGDVYTDAPLSVRAELTADTAREYESNDTPSRYNELYAGIPITGTSGKRTSTSDTDEDWYLCRLTEDGYATVTFSHEKVELTSVGWRVTLYDMALRELTYMNVGFSEATKTGGRVGLAAGCYLICVRGHVYSAVPYQLTLHATVAASYERESNDSFATATPLHAGTAVHGMMDERSAGIDYDYYALTLPEAGFVTLSFRHAVGEKDRDGWNIHLFNADGERIYTAISNWRDDAIDSPEIGLAAGTYYVRVDSDNLYFNSEVYTVLATFTPDPHREAEPNDSFERATPLPRGTRLRGSLLQGGLVTDVDYYSFTLRQTEDIQITFTHTASTLDRQGWTLRLVGEDGTVYPPLDAYGHPILDSDGAPLTALSINWNAAVVTANYSLREGRYCFIVDPGFYYSPVTYGVLLSR